MQWLVETLMHDTCSELLCMHLCHQSVANEAGETAAIQFGVALLPVCRQLGALYNVLDNLLLGRLGRRPAHQQHLVALWCGVMTKCV